MYNNNAADGRLGGKDMLRFSFERFKISLNVCDNCVNCGKCESVVNEIANASKFSVFVKNGEGFGYGEVSPNAELGLFESVHHTGILDMSHEEDTEKIISLWRYSGDGASTFYNYDTSADAALSRVLGIWGELNVDIPTIFFFENINAACEWLYLSKLSFAVCVIKSLQ